MSDDQISIQPGVAMLGLFPHMTYQPWYALGELVDNAIQSYVANRERLRAVEGLAFRLKISVEISKLNGGSIEVKDNAAGISANDWQRAFKVAEPPSDASGLSQFGIGMKAACCWFAREWSVRSSHLGESVVRSVSFDVPRIVRERDDSLAVLEESIGANSHFTVVQMRNMHRIPQGAGVAKVRQHLASIYRDFLRDGDVEISVNGDLLEYEEIEVLRVSRFDDPDGQSIDWYKEVDFQLESGRRVTGFVMIRKTGATKTNGLSLLYRRKVVTGAAEETYRPQDIYGQSGSFRSQRVCGELCMDDFGVTYTKNAIVWADEEEEFVEKLHEVMRGGPFDLLKQADEYRARKPEVMPKKTADGLASDIASAFDNPAGSAAPEFKPRVSAEDAEKIAETYPYVITAEPEAAPESELIEVDRAFDLQVATGEQFQVTLKLVIDEANPDWLRVKSKDGENGAQVTLTVNQAHPFMRAFCEAPTQELEPVWRVAVAVGLGQVLAQQAGAILPSLVVASANELLRNNLARKS